MAPLLLRAVSSQSAPCNLIFPRKDVFNNLRKAAALVAGVPRYQLRTTYGTTSSLSLRFSATLLRRRVGVSRPLGSWCPTALQIVLSWGMVSLLAPCHEGQLSLKFDCVFVPVDFMHLCQLRFPLHRFTLF